MKIPRYIVLTIMLITLLISGGCGSKTYVFDFTTEEDLLRSDGDWELMASASPGDSSYEHTPKGLVMKNYHAVAPHTYSGDFKWTVDFNLQAEGADVAVAHFFLLSEISAEPLITGINLYGVGSDDEGFYILDSFETVILGPVSPIPGIVRNGPNRLEIERRSGRFKYVLNGTVLTSNLQMTEYDLDLFIPVLWGWQSADISSTYSLIFKRVEIEYSGEQVLR